MWQARFGGGQTDDAGESWNGGKYDGTQKVERGKRERCDRIFGGKRWDRIRRKKESGRQKPESDRHRWQRDDCPNLQQVSVQTGAFRQSCWYSLPNSVENKLSACRIKRSQSKWNTLLTVSYTQLWGSAGFIQRSGNFGCFDYYIGIYCNGCPVWVSDLSVYHYVLYSVCIQWGIDGLSLIHI